MDEKLRLKSFFFFQENKLKVALLEYLRRQHPDDADKFSMVAHHFSMHREIAQTLEETALKQLANLGDCFPGIESVATHANIFTYM